MFSLAENMKWSHLPSAGGIYDQNPELLARWRYIFFKRNEHEAEEHRKREREMKQRSGKGAGRRVAGRRH